MVGAETRREIRRNGSLEMGGADRPDGLDHPAEIAQRINSASVPGWCKELQVDWELDSFYMNEGLTVAHLVKYPPAMRETWVRSLGWGDPLEKGKATPHLHSPTTHMYTHQNVYSSLPKRFAFLLKLQEALSFCTTSYLP